MPPIIRHMGDRGLLIELGCGIDPVVNRRVKRLHRIIARERLHGVVESVPAYASLLVVFDPLQASPETLKRQIIGLCDFDDTDEPVEDRAVVEIPVVYGGEAGPDLDAVAAHHGLSVEDVIGLHTGTTYRVYMIGFTPGFPYMGELPEALDTPRRDTPRTRIPKGSVAIAQRQTGIYPAISPGGWQIIGRTPLALFDPHKETPSFLTMGDAVRFTPVTPEEVAQWPL
jgi:inhibitor of KinA